MSIHQCPKCQLRYLYRSELDLHLREDHRDADEPDTTAERAGDERGRPRPAGVGEPAS